MTRDLNIRADINSRGARQGARETNKAQDEIGRKAREVGREQAKQQSSLTQQMKSREREQKKLERSLDSLERKAALHGTRGLQRIRAQEIAMKAQARAAGATADQIKRIGAAYDQMAAKAVAAQRRTQASRGARSAGGGASGFAVGALAARAGGLAAGAYGAYSLASSIGPLAERAGRLSDLPAALGQIANNSGVAESRVRGVVQQLYDLDFSMVQAQKSTAMFAQAGIPKLLDRLQDLAKGARNLSVVSGIAPSEALEGIGGAILKGELDLLETQGLVGIKFEDGYKRFAAAAGKTTAALTEQEKVLSRLQQVLEKLLAVQGVYERSLDTSGGSLRELSVQGDRAYDALAKLLDPTITAGASALAGALGSAAGALNSMQSWTASPDFKSAMLLLSVVSDVGGGVFKPLSALGFIPSVFGTKQPTPPPVGAQGSLVNFVGPLRETFVGPLRSASGGGGASGGPSPAPKPAPGGYYGFDELAARNRDLTRRRSGAVGSIAQLNASLGLAQRTNPTTGPGVPLAVGGVQPAFFGANVAEEGLASLERWKTARDNQIKDEQQAITRANEQLFRDLKFQSADLFRAMVGGGQQFWNFFKNAGLTAMSEIFSNSVAGMLTGGRGGGAGVLGGVLGGGFGGVSRPGAPGGTSGFAGPVAGVAGSAARGGFSLAGLGSTLAGGAGALGLAGAVGAAQLPGRGRAAGGLRGAAVGGSAGVGAIGGLLALAPGLVATGPLGAAILGGGLAIGGLIGTLTTGARAKARQKVREVYKVTVRDGGILDQIVAAGRDFGSMAVAVHSPGIRDLVQLYAMSTGQDPAGGVSVQMASAVRLRSVGGLLFQDVQYSQGRPVAAPSSLPLLGVGRNAAVNVVNLDPQATTAALETAAYRAVAQSGELVQAVGDRAMRQSAGRRTQAALLLEPMTAVGS